MSLTRLDKKYIRSISNRVLLIFLWEFLSEVHFDRLSDHAKSQFSTFNDVLLHDLCDVFYLNRCKSCEGLQT